MIYNFLVKKKQKNKGGGIKNEITQNQFIHHLKTIFGMLI